MKTLSRWALLGILPLLLGADRPWQEVTVPTLAEVGASFANPPKEYGAIHWAIWGGPQTKERIISDIDTIAVNGGGVYMINNSQRVQPAYLSPEYMDLVKTVVQECKKNGMKVWIETDCGYPDGFAGGLISKDYPQLGMKAIIGDARCTVAAGQTLDIPLPVDTLGIVANPVPASAPPAADAPAPEVTRFPLPADGNFMYAVPRGGAGELTVQLPNADVRYSLSVGEPFSIPAPPGTKSIFLSSGGGRGRGGRGGGGAQEGTVVPLPADGQLKWTAPAGTGAWELTFIRHAYRTSATRNDNGIDGGATKDSLYTLIDYLDPEATATYIKLINETYAKAVGDEFGKTVLGFRGDETDFGVTPWTPKLFETFQAQKGYDLKPYIPQLFGGVGGSTPEIQRVRADYADVWSGMFRDNFYKVEQDWCRARGMDYMVHLNHEETMLSLVRSEGSFWRDMRYVGVPGIDNLNQIGPGIVADFPKLAASAAHVYGHPQVWEEEGGNAGLQGKFIADYQLVRGVNFMNIRGLNSAPAAGSNPLQDPNAAIGSYVSRAQYLLANGRPAAQVALFHPTDSMWMGDRDSDTATVKLATQLLEHQIDFDHIDADSLATVCTLEGGGLKNLSGQIYKAVIVPSSTVIQKNMLERLRAFAKAGGKVVFVGRTPTMVVDKTFLHADETAPDLSFATLEPTEEITPRVVSALPKPDVALDSPCPPIKYTRRSYRDGEVYFFFNESDQRQSRTATLAGSGQVQVWDAGSGVIHPVTGAIAKGGAVKLPLALGPYESRLIVIGPLPAGVGSPQPAVLAGQSLLDLAGDWSVSLGERQLTTPLKSWQDLGVADFTGTALYRKEFTAPAGNRAGQRVYLVCDDIREVARVRLNGVELEARGWQPYDWDVTQALKSGANVLEIEVQGASAGGRRGGATAARGGRGAAGGLSAAPESGGRGAEGAPETSGAVPPRGGRGAAGPAGAARGAGAGASGRRGGGAAPAVYGLLPSVRLLAI